MKRMIFNLTLMIASIIMFVGCEADVELLDENLLVINEQEVPIIEEIFNQNLEKIAKSFVASLNNEEGQPLRTSSGYSP